MAEVANTQELSIEELRARLCRVIVETDDKPAQRRAESASSKSDTAAPPLTEPLYSAMPPLQRLDFCVVSAALFRLFALLNPAAALASSTPQSTGTSSDPTPAPASASGLYARESGSAPLFDYAGKQVPLPSMLHAAPAEKEQREEPLLGHVGEHLPVPSRVPNAAPAGKSMGAPLRPCRPTGRNVDARV